MALKPIQGALAGYRVLDLTAVLSGPVATQIMGDYGAEIVKVENPGGDMMRANGVSRNVGMSSIFIAVNRNKRSICLDLRSKEGADVLRRLIPQMDVFTHNMRVEAIERLGFGYKDVAAINPKIVYCAITGFDEDGPDKGKPAFDDVIQAGSGMAALVSMGRETPDFVPSLIADKTAGMAMANAILAALLYRERTGKGQYIEVPMLETISAFVLTEHLGGRSFHPATAPAGYSRVLPGGRKPAATKDGHIAILPYTEDQWCDFFKAMEREDLIETLHIHDKAKRNANIQMLYAEMRKLLSLRTTAENLELCRKYDIPATQIYALDELTEHPQLQAVNLFERAEHPSEGAINYIRPATKFSASPANIHHHAPRLGENSRAILKDYGFADAEIAALIDKDVVREAKS